MANHHAWALVALATACMPAYALMQNTGTSGSPQTHSANSNTVATVELRSSSSGDQPFTVGLGLRKGDVPGFPILALSDSQVIVKSRWNDGSVRHAIASGHATLVAGVPLSLAVEATTTPPGGVPLTSQSIQSANPAASVTLGALGTVNLSTLLATPVRTWLSGPEMVEAHYRGAANGNSALSVEFHVRLYKSGRVFVRVLVENGWLDLPGSDLSYIPTVSIGGVQVFNNGGATLNHRANTRWLQQAWIGGDVTLQAHMDTAYLVSSRLVPNYFGDAPDAAALNALTQTYAPMQRGDWTAQMGETGFQEQIGLLPLWDALYVTSAGDPRAQRAVLANAMALSSYPIVWKDSLTQLTATPSGRPTWTVYGPNQGGGTQLGAGALQWDIAHHGSGGYLAYLISGDYAFLQTMSDQASVCYLLNSSGNGSGTSRVLLGQTRGMAWCLRTLSQYAALAPTGDAVAADYRNLLASNLAHWATVTDSLGASGIGYFYEYNIDLYAPGTVAPWQQHFLMQTLGMGSDLEPLTDMTAFRRVRDWAYQGVVGILGAASGYCFNYAGNYTTKISDGGNASPASWYANWSQVFTATHGAATCTNTLLGSSGGDPASARVGYWGNLLPAIAYAVDHQAPGAAQAWARLTGASNWAVLRGSGFGNVPIWGIQPRPSENPDLIFSNSFESS